MMILLIVTTVVNADWYGDSIMLIGTSIIWI